MEKKKSLADSIREMPLDAFITLFCRIKYKNKWVQFKLWPKQVELCEWLDGLALWMTALIPKPRQTGISEIASARALKTLIEKPGCQGIIFSKSEKFAKYFLKHRFLPKFNKLPKIEGITWPKIKRQTEEEIEFDNGSILFSLTSSKTGGASMSPEFVIFDEAGGIEENYGNFEDLYNNTMPALEQAEAPWCMVIGTSVPGTRYNDMVRDSIENPDSEYQNFFLPWNADPTRDDAWYKRQQNRLGDAVHTQFPRSLDDFFFVKEGLVFKNFDYKEGGQHVNYFDGNEIYNFDFYTTYDHGYNDPACDLFGFYDKYEDHLYIHDELYYQKNHHTDISIISVDIKKKLAGYPKKAKKMIADTAIFNKTGGVISNAVIFKRFGISFGTAHKYDKKASLQLLSERFTHNKITIHPQCYNFIDELRRYRWDAKKKGEVPLHKDAHSIDPCRYLCAELRKQNPAPIHQESEAYSDLRRERIEEKKRMFKNRMFDGMNNNRGGSGGYQDWQSA